jgi:hypothetical protein
VLGIQSSDLSARSSGSTPRRSTPPLRISSASFRSPAPPPLRLFFLLLFFAFLFVTAVRETGFRANLPKLWIGGAMILTVGGGIAAVQLLPTLELLPHSLRATMTFEKAQEGRLA